MANALYPVHQAEFATWLDNLATTVASDPAAWGATQAQSDLMSSVNASFQAAYTLAITPETRTKPSVAGKKTALKFAKREAKNFADIIRASPTISDPQLADLGIARRANRSPTPPPTAMAKLAVLSTGPNSVRVRVYGDGSLRRGKPESAIGCVAMSYIGEEAPTDPRQWTLEGTTSKSTFDVVLPADIAPGSLVWIAAYFVNRKLEKGPTTYPPTQIRVAGRVNVAQATATRLAA